MTITDLPRLHGQTVLVKSSRDQHNPPIAMRGTLEVLPAKVGQRSEVKLVIDFPEMISQPAHQRTLVLTDDEIAGLKTAPVGGFEFVTDQNLE